MAPTCFEIFFNKLVRTTTKQNKWLFRSTSHKQSWGKTWRYYFYHPLVLCRLPWGLVSIRKVLWKNFHMRTARYVDVYVIKEELLCLMTKTSARVAAVFIFSRWQRRRQISNSRKKNKKVRELKLRHFKCHVMVWPTTAEVRKKCTQQRLYR